MAWQLALLPRRELRTCTHLDDLTSYEEYRLECSALEPTRGVGSNN